MNGLVSTHSPLITPENSEYVVDGWFPPIDLAALRNRVRIGEGVVSHERLFNAVEGAVLTALRNLAEWRALHALDGIDALTDIDDIQIGGINRPVVLWNRIILYYTAAEIADTHRDISATDQGDTRADQENVSADDYRRLAHNAINDLRSIKPLLADGSEDTARIARNIVDLI